MAGRAQVLMISQANETVALRLLSALVLGWDEVPTATQGWLIRDAALMTNGRADSLRLPAEILAFIEANKTASRQPGA
jgi:hypothetical protein